MRSNKTELISSDILFLFRYYFISFI